MVRGGASLYGRARGLGDGERFRDCPEYLEMTLVLAGSFMIGSPDTEVDRYGDEGPLH